MTCSTMPYLTIHPFRAIESSNSFTYSKTIPYVNFTENLLCFSLKTQSICSSSQSKQGGIWGWHGG